MINPKAVFSILKKINEPITESYTPILSNKIINHFKESLSDPRMIVHASALLHKHVAEQYNQETATCLLERLVEHKFIPSSITKHNIGTPEGFMKAFEEVMAEMVSGAGIGGAFDGAQSNADANATGMAAPNGAKKKKNKLENIIQRRL